MTTQQENFYNVLSKVAGAETTHLWLPFLNATQIQSLGPKQGIQGLVSGGAHAFAYGTEAAADQRSISDLVATQSTPWEGYPRRACKHHPLCDVKMSVALMEFHDVLCPHTGAVADVMDEICDLDCENITKDW